MKVSSNCVLILIFFYLLTGCSSYDSPKYVRIANDITMKTAGKLNDQAQLHLAGIGGGMMDNVQMMAMMLDYYNEVEFKKARELIVYVVNTYLEEINNNIEIRPYLVEYPFTARNVEVVIFFYCSEGISVPEGKIKIVAAKEGKIIYYIDQPENDSIKAIYQETFEQAEHALLEI